MIIPARPKDLFIVKLILLHHHALRCCLEGFLQERAGKCTAILGKGIALQIRAGQGTGIVGRGAALQIRAGKGAAILGKGRFRHQDREAHCLVEKSWWHLARSRNSKSEGEGRGGWREG